MRTVIIKNNRASDPVTYESQMIDAASNYVVANEQELLTFASCQALLNDITATSPETVINDGARDLAPIAGVNWLVGNIGKFSDSGIQLISYTTPQNEHSLDPSGIVKGYFNAKDHVCSIVLSNKNSRTFSYNSDCPIDPEKGAYVLNESATERSEIEEVDLVNHTVTFSDGTECFSADGADLSEGTFILSVPHYLYAKVPSKDTNVLVVNFGGLPLPAMCLWGIMVDADGYHKNDFLEMGIVCKDGIPLVENPRDPEEHPEDWAIPPNGWHKDYDYSWIKTVLKTGKITAHDADGAPGLIPSGFYSRIKYYYTKVETNDKFVDVWLDYIFTVKDA